MANELFNVKDKVVVVTGGTGVLCKNISKYLAEQGAIIIALGRKEERFLGRARRARHRRTRGALHNKASGACPARNSRLAGGLRNPAYDTH